MTKENRQTLVFSFVVSFMVTVMIAISVNMGNGEGIYGAPSGQASYFDNMCTVNMTKGRTIAEMNNDFLWCYDTFTTTTKLVKSTSSATYHNGDYCVVSFSDLDTEESAYSMWIECVFDHLAYLAESK